VPNYALPPNEEKTEILRIVGELFCCNQCVKPCLTLDEIVRESMAVDIIGMSHV
jgi:hypothetical protein